jgi:hypothetical protein
MPKNTTWIKLGPYFIREDNIRSIKRMGSGTKIIRILGEDIVVEVDYEKVKGLLPSSKI